MATLSHSGSRRLYSWWWNSHISPKNSKWLEENLADMDSKIKVMIKIIEEDADSFAKRAEMYYKKRPELMKLVEEFYRAYRALAERYDNATGVLRQAHRTMAVVFPNQIPLEISDELPTGFPASEAEPMNSEMFELFDGDDASGLTSLYEAMKTGRAFPEEIDLKNLHEMFTEDFADGGTIMDLSFRKEGGKDTEMKLLREEISQLSQENLNFKNQITLQSDRADRAEIEAQQLRESCSKEKAEKEDALLRYGESMARIAYLEAEISRIQEDLKRLNDEMSKEARSLTCSEEQILLLEKANRALQLELDALKKLKEVQQEELYIKGEELARLETSMEDEHARLETALQSAEKQYVRSQEETRIALEKVKEMEVTKLRLEEELQKVREENNRANEQKLLATLKIIDLQDEIISLRGLKGKLQNEVKLCKEEKELQYQELCEIKEDRNNLEKMQHLLKKQIQDANAEMESEKIVHLKKLEDIEEQYRESQEDSKSLNEKLKEMELSDLSLKEKLQKVEEENNRLNEQSLSSTVEILNLQDEIIFLKDSKAKLKDEFEICREDRRVLHLELFKYKDERNSLKEQVEAVTREMESLQAMITELRDGNDDLNELVEKLRQENTTLNEQKLLSTIRMINLQDEIMFLKNIQEKLGEELERCRGEKEVLNIELCQLKDDGRNSAQRHCILQEQIQAVTVEMENLQAMIKELKDGNNELKETIKKHECQQVFNSRNLRKIQSMSEKNGVLEASLSDANAEVEALRENIKVLEKRYENLSRRIFLDEDEKDLLLSHMDVAAQNIEELLGRNTFLENSLSDVNVELNTLKGNFKIIDECCRSLHGQKYSLLSETDTLQTKVESISWSFRNLENSYTELEGKCSNLEREKASALQCVAELQEFLWLEKEKHQSLVHSSKNQLSALENQIHLQEQQCWKMGEELRVEQQMVINGQIEIFILQRCLHDIKEESIRHRSAGKLIIELKQKCITKEKEIAFFEKKSETLRGWIVQITNMLEIDLKCGSLDDAKEEFLLQLILHEVRRLINSISEAHDEKQILILEKSVVVTLLQQFGLYVADLRGEVLACNRETQSREKDFAVLIEKNNKIFEANKQLEEKLQSSSQREELLKDEADILFRQLSQLQEAHRKLQRQTARMVEENQFLSKKLNAVTIKKESLEEETNFLLAEIMTLDYLCASLTSYLAETGLEMKLLSDERDYLCKAQDELIQEIMLVHKRVKMLELENKQLKLSFTNLYECRRCLSRLQNDMNMARNVINACENLNLQTYTENNLLRDKDMELQQEKQIVQQLQVKKSELAKEEMEKTDNCGMKKDSWDTGLQNGTDEVKNYQSEISSLLNDIQSATVSVTFFRDKVVEQILQCESIQRNAMLQRKALHDEIVIRDETVNELKEKVNSLEVDNRRLNKEVNMYMSILETFLDDINILEEQTQSLGKYHPSPSNQGKQGNQVSHMYKKQEISQAYGARSQPGIPELCNLKAKIKSLQKMVKDTRSLLELERLDSNASLEAAWQEIEALRSKDNSGNDSRKKKYEKIMRDIELDIALNASSHPTQLKDIHYQEGRKRENVKETFYQRLEMWGTTENGSGKQKQKSPILTEEAERSYASNELVSEKELGVDKLEEPKKTAEIESDHEWSQMATERLCSNAQRLLALQASMQELHKKMEALEKIDNGTLEFDAVKVQLKEAEGTISKLVDLNSKLTDKAGELSEPNNEVREFKKDGGSRNRRQISGRAEKVSEKIGKLELELQKVQLQLKKMEEENSIRKTKIVEKSGMLLKEYIYGKREIRKKKRGSCRCMRPKTKGD